MTLENHVMLMAGEDRELSGDLQPETESHGNENVEVYSLQLNGLDGEQEDLHKGRDEFGEYTEICFTEVMASVISNEQQLEDFRSCGNKDCRNIATMRIYISEKAKRAVVIEDDLLTRKEVEHHKAEVADATHKEISKWLDHKCFEKHLLKDARNLMTSRYVVKWKWVKDPKDPT